MKRLLRPPEFAELLGVTVKTLANWRSASNGPPHLKVGGLVRYDEDAVARWLEEQQQ